MNKDRPRKSRRRENAVPLYPTSIWLSEDLRDDLRKEAAARDRSMSWMIKEILKQWQAFAVRKRQAPRMPRIKSHPTQAE